MTCSIAPERIEATITFHGHSCPGLAIGIRAAEYALDHLQDDDANLVAVVETDMCGVDAIQFLTSCTLGKGNLIHKDYGKMAFSFHDRTSGRASRLVLKPEVRSGLQEEMTALLNKISGGAATEAEKQRLTEVRQAMQDRYMTLPLEELFTITPITTAPPKPARILASLTCDACGESTMESRTRRFAGRTLCIPCFSKEEQKI
jgi:formylmethanofuran dehydrogenase subunit E